MNNRKLVGDISLKILFLIYRLNKQKKVVQYDSFKNLNLTDEQIDVAIQDLFDNNLIEGFTDINDMSPSDIVPNIYTDDIKITAFGEIVISEESKFN